MNFLSINYFTRGFWGDEAWTALISQQSIPEIIRITGEDFHPPFYYFIVHFWGQLFNYGETTIRLISVFFFLLTPIVVYFLTQSFFKDKRISLTSSLLVLLSPILLTYAFEARSYALLAFLSVSSAYAFWQARTEKGNSWKLIYFLLGSVSVYTHYYAWFILASHGIYLLLFERENFKKMLPPAIGILLVQLPWIPTLLSQVGEVNRDYWIAPINHRTHAEFFLRVAGGDHTTMLQFPAAFLIAYFVLAGLFSKNPKSSSLPIKFILTWIIIPTLIPSLISLKTPVFFYRYLIFSAIPLLILTVNGLHQISKKSSIIGLIFLVSIYLYINNKSLDRHPRSMREVKPEVYQQKIPGDGAIYTVLPSFAEVTYYFADTDEIKVLDEGIVQFSGKSLLDSYVRQSIVKIVDPPKSDYWFLEPGPKANLVQPLDSTELE